MEYNVTLLIIIYLQKNSPTTASFKGVENVAQILCFSTFGCTAILVVCLGACEWRDFVSCIRLFYDANRNGFNWSIGISRNVVFLSKASVLSRTVGYALSDGISWVVLVIALGYPAYFMHRKTIPLANRYWIGCRSPIPYAIGFVRFFLALSIRLFFLSFCLSLFLSVIMHIMLA